MWGENDWCNFNSTSAQAWFDSDSTLKLQSRVKFNSSFRCRAHSLVYRIPRRDVSNMCNLTLAMRPMCPVAYPAYGHSGHALYHWLWGAHAASTDRGGMTTFYASVNQHAANTSPRNAAVQLYMQQKKTSHQPVAYLWRPHPINKHAPLSAMPCNFENSWVRHWKCPISVLPRRRGGWRGCLMRSIGLLPTTVWLGGGDDVERGWGRERGAQSSPVICSSGAAALSYYSSPSLFTLLIPPSGLVTRHVRCCTDIIRTARPCTSKISFFL